MISAIFDVLNIGLVLLDTDLRVTYWNRWMELQSGIESSDIVNKPLFEFFPNLDTPKFHRNFKAVRTFGNFAFFSQKLHRYLFPFKPTGSYALNMEFMQQSCLMGPLRDETNNIKNVFITVQDSTANVIYEQSLQKMNVTDTLTGVYNRRFLDGRMHEELARSRRAKNPLSVVMLDIDHFKKVNDTYGHRCGDFILKSTASICFSCLRESDVLVRYGGEEFICLLTETDGEGAAKTAERLRKAVEEHVNYFDTYTINVTISLGVAVMREDDTPEKMIERADCALYEAKRSGRNKVVFS
jgi:diguanylate cyclase (GGDEF)-like protein